MAVQLAPGTIKRQINLGLVPETVERLRSQAAAVGVPMNIYVAELVDSCETDATGFPLWWKNRPVDPQASLFEGDAVAS